MIDDLGVKIYDLLVEEAPELLTGDIAANSRCCGALAENLGRLMADMIVEQGQDFYEQAKTIAFAKIDTVAQWAAAEAEPGVRPSRPIRH